MAITSEEIHNQGFTVDRKGYDVDEVDVFLEHVAAEIDNLNAEIDELRARLAQYEGQGDYLDDEPMDMDAAFAEPASPEQLAAEAEEPAAPAMSDDEKDARIAELERQLEEQKTDASAIASALVTAQRSAQEVIDAANAERAKIEDAIEELERSHKQTCESYSEALKAFIDDANKKLDDIEDELAKRDGKKRAHARFSSPVQAPVHKPAPAGATGAVAPSYTAPAMPNAGVTAAVTPAATIPAQVKPSTVEKDLSGFGDASDAFDLGDID